ncbi:MAG: hypothetical protein KAJ78_00085 [Acidobacteria bacterium]|nr:hypothetical protein [Acidobacteriota bacterium]
MKENRWMQVLVAAVIIVLAGSVIALAETVDVEVEVDGEASTTVEVRTDDSIDVFTLDDLADGEERVIESGEHTITVRRTGDEITVLMDGESLGGSDGAMIQKMIMLGEPTDGDENKIVMIGGHHGHKFIECDSDGEGVKIIKIRKGEGGENFVWHGDGDSDFEDILIELKGEIGEGELAEIKLILEQGLDGGEMVFFGDHEDGEIPKIIKMGGIHGAHGAHFGKVRYRCEETGSMLLVDPEHASQDTLVDPASGCLMTKVANEEPQVIMIKKEIRIIDED